MKRLSCKKCKEIYGDVPTPCDTCYPGVHDYNVPIVELYGLVGDQFIMGFNGPVALNVLALFYVFDNMYEEVENKEYFISKMKEFTNEMLSKMKESSKK